MQIVAQIQGTSDASQALTVNVNEPTTVQVKLENYVSVGGMLLQASTLTTIIIIVVIAILFVVVEVIRRRKTKSAAQAATNFSSLFGTKFILVLRNNKKSKDPHKTSKF